MVDQAFENKAKKIKLVATDIDGVWTDGTMYYSPQGEAMKAFSTYDGMAVAMLRKAGLEVAILTGENSATVKARAEKLKIPHLFLGEQNKAQRLQELCTQFKIDISEVAYIGDDINDTEVLEMVGLSALACNSPILDNLKPDYVTRRKGGQGAFRDFVDCILKAKTVGVNNYSTV
ncbi:3-deoxy-D-manno-octulosonate 8-phosphate phosphatase [Chitinispirillum alkaliphilum]|nr:3-deoxy-D-manno-octulosonate 8-phosphate phosphatase [Chitinispirillum alkaliphilum]